MIRVLVRISAVDLAGEKFSEQGHTLTISRHGATISLNRKLVPGLRLTICPVTSKKESSALVMGQMGGQSDVHVYGIALLEPTVNLWGIQFPPLAESEVGLVRLLLECRACKAREVVYLNELETEVLEANHSLPRSCNQCATWTLWRQTPSELPEHSGAQSELDRMLKAAPGPTAERDRNLFWLYYLQGLTADEIAALPGSELSAKGVESALRRVTTWLRKEMKARKPEHQTEPAGEIS